VELDRPRWRTRVRRKSPVFDRFVEDCDVRQGGQRTARGRHAQSRVGPWEWKKPNRSNVDLRAETIGPQETNTPAVCGSRTSRPQGRNLRGTPEQFRGTLQADVTPVRTELPTRVALGSACWAHFPSPAVIQTRPFLKLQRAKIARGCRDNASNFLGGRPRTSCE